MKITGKELQQWGLPTGPVYKVLLDVIAKLELHKKQARRIVRTLIKDPQSYLGDEDFGDAAKLLIPSTDKDIELNDKGCPVRIYGKHMIEEGAINQLTVASMLPISMRGALLPDGHQGYGLPIGGVLATDNVVIPFGVGMDIACRMHMSVTDIPAKEMEGMRGQCRNALKDNTFFGVGCVHDGKNEHAVTNDDRLDIHSVKKFKEKLKVQLGTSGSGNHFVEYGKVKLVGQEGEWLAILSHSGSRGFGSEVAKFYTDIAMKRCKLPKVAKHLAWLSLDDEDGQEYWEVMNLAGDYARASHSIIHSRILKALSCDLVHEYENHHNFAWKEAVSIDGQYKDAIVHRKGATPAGKGVVGLIPGSLSTPAYIVEGKGCDDSLSSSSHGAGRTMSRKQAKETFTLSDMKKDLESKGIELVEGSLDECKDCYKDINKVIEEQSDLVEIKGTFLPWMVRMAGEHIKPWENKK